MVPRDIRKSQSQGCERRWIQVLQNPYALAYGRGNIHLVGVPVEHEDPDLEEKLSERKKLSIPTTGGSN